MLHQKHIRDLLNVDNKRQTAVYAKYLLNPSKLKSAMINTKIDGLLKQYLLSKHHSEQLTKKDEILIELVQQFPMIYSFRTRSLFFKLTAFDSSRNKYFASEYFTKSIPKSEGGITISRRKIEISRDNIYDNMLDKLRDIQKDKSFLEFQFENEVGTGLGPTLELYSLISEAIKETPNMWKETSDNTLYPMPLNLK